MCFKTVPFMLYCYVGVGVGSAKKKNENTEHDVALLLPIEILMDQKKDRWSAADFD